jgi:hypothetical protein
MLDSQVVKVGSGMVGLATLDFRLPPGGAPPIADWLTCFRSMIFTGVQLAREPVDVGVSSSVVGASLGDRMLRIVKGYTRSSCVMLVALAAAEMDLSSPDCWALFEPLHPLLDFAWLVPAQVLFCFPSSLGCLSLRLLRCFVQSSLVLLGWFTRSCRSR